MRKYLLILLCFVQAGAWAAGGEREVIDFSASWKFHLGDVPEAKDPLFKDAGWRSLDVPHDWSIEGDFSKDHPATPGGGALPGGTGWYRKTFDVPAEDRGRLIYIDFDGVYHQSEVWINGHYLGKRPNGYISFRYELSKFLRFGEKNVLSVKVDNAKQPNSRWYSGSGIYRKVSLVKVDPVHVPQYGTFVTTPQVSAERAEVAVRTTVLNASAKRASVRLNTIVRDAGGVEVASIWQNQAILPGKTFQFNQRGGVTKPRMWSVGDPALYTAVSRVYIGKKLVDTYETTFGIRTFRFDADKGFSLNGVPMKIQGVCNHHDLGALGAAFNRRAAERQLEILKGMGCNGIRTSHNPPAPELLELCDRMGFIVMDEAFDMWKKQKNPFDYHQDWDQWHRRDLEDLVKRDRNHPSVFIWSVGNEIQEQWGDEAKGDTTGRVIARELVSIVRSLDTTRAITTANNEVNTYNNLLKSGAFDLIGYNYNHRLWANFHERWPGKKFIVTESTSALQTRGHYDLVPFDTIRRWPEAWDKPIKGGGNADFTVSAYDHVSAPWGSTHEESLKALHANAHVSGMYVWTGFDYLGEPTPYPWPARSSYFGIVDLAGFPKDVYWLYKSVWTNQPVLHLYPHWNWKVGDTVDVVAYYSQADEVELFLNGKSLGGKKKTADELHVKWRVPFAEGHLHAVSRKGGVEVLSEDVYTAGKPAKIELLADRSNLTADGRDLSFVTVRVLDEAGHVVPGADNLVRFHVSGAGVLNAVDNGSPTSHERFKADKRKAFNGMALAIIQSGKAAGEIRVEAVSEGLQGSEIVLTVK
ncbi:MAG: beta-galactosidase GalB [Arcticibacter sp.]